MNNDSILLIYYHFCSYATTKIVENSISRHDDLVIFYSLKPPHIPPIQNPADRHGEPEGEGAGQEGGGEGDGFVETKGDEDEHHRTFENTRRAGDDGNHGKEF